MAGQIRLPRTCSRPEVTVPIETRAASTVVEATGAITTLPILLLHVHEHCNCRCLMCDIWQRTDGRELDLADFARHRESIVRLGVREVVLTGGEALLHRGFGALCAFLRDCGVCVTLLTTGLLLEKRADLVAAGVDEIIVSIDGPEEVHDRVRRVKGAHRLIGKGIAAVRERRPGIPVNARSTVQKANHGVIRQTVAGAKAIGLDSISFLATDLTSQAFNRDVVWPILRQDEVALSRAEVNALEEEVEALIEENAADFRNRYIVESPEKMRRIVRRFKEHLGECAPVAPMCNAPWVSAVVEVDGTVRPCFFHEPIGSVAGMTLDEAINGDEARRFRASLDVESNPICRRCVCSLNYRVSDPSGQG
jgi:MoaA/NifB/PqqE/SkfB family radical SAM enzyme